MNTFRSAHRKSQLAAPSTERPGTEPRCERERRRLGHLEQQLTDGGVRAHIETDGRLVREQHARGAQQARGELCPHALTQRQEAHGPVQQGADAQGVDQQAEALAKLPRLALVHPPEQLEGVASPQVVPELRALAEHGAQLEGQALALGPRDVAEHPGFAGRGVQYHAEHLQRRGPARAVGPDERDALTRLRGERNAVHRRDAGVTRRDEVLAAGDERPRATFSSSVALGELEHFDDGRFHGFLEAPFEPQKCRTPFRRLRKGAR